MALADMYRETLSGRCETRIIHNENNLRCRQLSGDRRRALAAGKPHNCDDVGGDMRRRSSSSSSSFSVVISPSTIAREEESAVAVVVYRNCRDEHRQLHKRGVNQFESDGRAGDERESAAASDQ
jgi:hypothetical protein